MSRLFVYVPGLKRNPEKAKRLEERLRKDPDWADATFLTWDTGIRRLNRRRFADAANSLATHLDAAWSGEGDIVLMGHSLGGLIVRRAYLIAIGAYPPLPARPWGAAVSRIVLFASPNRGFRDENLLWLWRVLLHLVAPLGFSLLDIRAGSTFVTDLRIRWIRTISHLETQQKAPYVVQLLGDRDSLVGHIDSLDVEQMRNAVQLGVPDADHSTITDVSGPEGEARYVQLRKAIFGQPQPAPPKEELSAEDAKRPVVFLLHGIRAGTDDWVARAKALLDQRAERPVARQPSYGYFSAWNFAMPFTRATNLRFMLDTYTQELAERPNATFHFLGHSNGTYILGQALQAVPAVEFENVFLAGSVLPPKYPWRASRSASETRAQRPGHQRHPGGHAVQLPSRLRHGGRGDRRLHRLSGELRQHASREVPQRRPRRGAVGRQSRRRGRVRPHLHAGARIRTRSGAVQGIRLCEPALHVPAAHACGGRGRRACLGRRTRRVVPDPGDRRCRARHRVWRDQELLNGPTSRRRRRRRPWPERSSRHVRSRRANRASKSPVAHERLLRWPR